MSEWYKNQKKSCSSIHQLLQERIEKTNLRRELTAEEVEEEKNPTYKVWIDDNFHFMNEDERGFHGEFDTPTQAIVACQKIVDANIESITENETDPDKAYESYTCFADDPWIEGVEFSAFEYAKIKIQEVLKG